MAESFSLLVLFNDKRLEGDDYFDRTARTALVQEGIQTIRAHFPSLFFGQPNPSTCAVNIRGPMETMQDLVAYLDDHKELGKGVVDGPMILIRPARPAEAAER